jgi:hypothetical protein
VRRPEVVKQLRLSAWDSAREAAKYKTDGTTGHWYAGRVSGLLVALLWLDDGPSPSPGVQECWDTDELIGAAGVAQFLAAAARWMP